MPKISQLPQDTSPLASDFIAGYKASIPATQKFLLSNILAFINANLSGITATQIANKTLTSAQFANPVWQYLGYAQITANPSAIGTSQTLVVGVTVTVPAGVTKVKARGYIGNVSGSTAPLLFTAALWQGTVGSGTQLNAMVTTDVSGTGQTGMIVEAIYAPTAGSYTYNLGFNTNSGTGTIEASSTQPTFIVVEYC